MKWLAHCGEVRQARRCRVGRVPVEQVGGGLAGQFGLHGRGIGVKASRAAVEVDDLAHRQRLAAGPVRRVAGRQRLDLLAQRMFFAQGQQAERGGPDVLSRACARCL